jgi:hypothetical protein
MSRLSQRAFVQSDLEALRQLLADLAGDDPSSVFAQASLQARLEEDMAVLAELERQSGKTAEAQLFFYGEPVAETHGIEAKFAGDVLNAYQDLVSKQAASLQGPVKRFGPTPAAKETRLHVTNILRGSFGFELEELTGPVDLFAPTPLAVAVDKVSELLHATQTSDEQFADAVAATHERVHSALERFLGVLQRANAGFRLVNEGRELRFNEDAVTQAYERARAIQEDETVVPVEGIFSGVLAESRRFEHLTDSGQVIQGSLGESVLPAALAQMTSERCRAHLRRITLQRGHKTLVRYVLLELEDSEGHRIGSAPQTTEPEDVEFTVVDPGERESG